MKASISFMTFVLALSLASCRSMQTQHKAGDEAEGSSLKMKTADLGVEFLIHKPKTRTADAFLIFHGTVESDKQNLKAAQLTLMKTKKLIQRDDALYIAVAYPQENLFMGDNLKNAEAALLWLKKSGSRELGIEIKRIFLIGHSQGGYLVTRLNTLHTTNGVIANAPGPLNFKLRCELEEDRKIPSSNYCNRMKARFGSTKENPTAYDERSLLTHIKNFKSKILFTQGMSDTKLQLTSWPVLKSRVAACASCGSVQFKELEGGHDSLFDHPDGHKIVQQFLDSSVSPTP